jgi:hypothetical protein
MIYRSAATHCRVRMGASNARQMNPRKLARFMSALTPANPPRCSAALSLTLSLATGCVFKQVGRKLPGIGEPGSARSRENDLDQPWWGKQVAAKISPSWYRLIRYHTVCISTAT